MKRDFSSQKRYFGNYLFMPKIKAFFISRHTNLLFLKLKGKTEQNKAGKTP
jgi:hypothetical protein